MILLRELGYWNLFKNMKSDKKIPASLSKAVTKQAFNKQAAKIDCLVKAIEKHKESTPDNDIRICDQKLWSAAEMINYGQ